MIYSITSIALLVGFIIYHYIKIGKLTDEMIGYKVKYESIKTYLEEITSSKQVVKTPAKKGRKPKK